MYKWLAGIILAVAVAMLVGTALGRQFTPGRQSAKSRTPAATYSTSQPEASPAETPTEPTPEQSPESEPEPSSDSESDANQGIPALW